MRAREPVLCDGWVFAGAGGMGTGVRGCPTGTGEARVGSEGGDREIRKGGAGEGRVGDCCADVEHGGDGHGGCGGGEMVKKGPVESEVCVIGGSYVG